MDDQNLKLILDFKAGKVSAFKKIYEIHFSKIFFFINSYTRNKEISEELTQDVFVKLWNYKQKIETSKSITSFIYTIAKNHTIDFIRKNSVKIYSIEGVNENKYALRNLGEDKLTFEEQERLLGEAIEGLSARKKEIFKLNRHENLTYKQISEKLGISASAVEKHISTALKEIKNYISKKSS